MTPAQKRPVSLDARVPTVDGHERARHEAVATDGEDELRHLFRLPDARHRLRGVDPLVDALAVDALLSGDLGDRVVH